MSFSTNYIDFQRFSTILIFGIKLQCNTENETFLQVFKHSGFFHTRWNWKYIQRMHNLSREKECLISSLKTIHFILRHPETIKITQKVLKSQLSSNQFNFYCIYNTKKTDLKICEEGKKWTKSKSKPLLDLSWEGIYQSESRKM